jgi:large subunit ribosomal protein L18
MKNRILKKNKLHQKKKVRIRKKISGTATKPRLSVFKSSQHLYIQAIDDVQGVTLASASTVEKGADSVARKDSAKLVGESIATRLEEKGIKQGVFDRNGFPFHGLIKIIADSAREKGLKI